MDYQKERINVELFFEKLLDKGVSLDYGSTERNILIDKGKNLLDELINKVQDDAFSKGQADKAKELYTLMEPVFDRLNNEIKVVKIAEYCNEREEDSETEDN